MPVEERFDVTNSSKGFFKSLCWLIVEFTNQSDNIYNRFKAKRGIFQDTIDAEADNDKKITRYMKFYADKTSQIDILLEDGHIVTYTFIILPFCKFESEEQQDMFFEKCVRTNAKTKCESLVSYSRSVIREMKTDYRMKQFLPWKLENIITYHTTLKEWFTYLGILLNFIIIASFSEEYGSRLEDPEFYNLSTPNTKILLTVVGSFSALMWSLIYIPIVIKKLDNVYYDNKLKNEKLKTKMQRDKLLIDPEFSLNIETRRLGKFLYTCHDIFFDIIYDLSLIFYTLFGVSIFLGLFLSPLWYVVLILSLVITSSTMKNLLKSIWEPLRQIVGTIILMLVITYLFIVVAYRYYKNSYVDNNWCHSVYSCLIISFDKSLKESGLGNALNSAYSFDEEDNRMNIDLHRVIFDNLEFFINFTLMIAIISGIIIDKFTEARQTKESIEDDRSSNCFICGKVSKDFDLNMEASDFKKHVQLEHNIWDYMYFIAYLRFRKEKHPKDITYIEKYVLDKLGRNDNSWFPCYAQENNEDD